MTNAQSAWRSPFGRIVITALRPSLTMGFEKITAAPLHYRTMPPVIRFGWYHLACLPYDVDGVDLVLYYT